MEIRELRKGDEYGVRALFELVFEKGLNEEEWLWKYRLSPWGSASTVALKDGLIIAHYGGVMLEFCQGQTTYMAYQICDVMTHPKYRAMFLARKGAMVRTAELFEDSLPMDFAFGFPSERHARLATVQLGVEKNRFVRALVKPVSAFKGKKKIFLNVRHGWNNIKGQEIDKLWNEIKDKYALTINKISSYILWRYRDCPTRQYQLLTFRSKVTRTLKGYAVIRMRENELQVLDFFTKKDFSIETFFMEIEGIASLQKAEKIRLWINPGEKNSHKFKSMGYAEEQGIPVTCKILNRDISLKPETFFETYCYRMGDYDAS